MELKSECKLVRIFIGETDKLDRGSFFETIVREARNAGLAGATVCRGVMGFGSSSRIRTAKILDLSPDLPVIVEIVDKPERIDMFLPILHDLFDRAGCGGLITMEDVKVIRYTPGKDK